MISSTSSECLAQNQSHDAYFFLKSTGFSDGECDDVSLDRLLVQAVGLDPLLREKCVNWASRVGGMFAWDPGRQYPLSRHKHQTDVPLCAIRLI